MKPLALVALACLAGLLSGCSDSDSGTNPPTVPDTPTGLAVVETGLMGMTLAWDVSDGASGYTLYRSPSASGTFTAVYSGADTTFADAGLDYVATYYYQVSAANSAGESDPSGTVSGTTLIPDGFVVTGSPSGQVDLTYNYYDDINSKPHYQSVPIGLNIVVASSGSHAGQWCFYDQIEQMLRFYNPTITDYPPRTGWLDATSSARTMILLTPFRQ